MEKVWFESHTGSNNAHQYGMSSALGATVADLPTDIPPGSTAFDYTAKKAYFYDGISWN